MGENIKFRWGVGLALIALFAPILCICKWLGTDAAPKAELVSAPACHQCQKTESKENLPKDHADCPCCAAHQTFQQASHVAHENLQVVTRTPINSAVVALDAASNSLGIHIPHYWTTAPPCAISGANPQAVLQVFRI